MTNDSQLRFHVRLRIRLRNTLYIAALAYNISHYIGLVNLLTPSPSQHEISTNGGLVPFGYGALAEIEQSNTVHCCDILKVSMYISIRSWRYFA